MANEANIAKQSVAGSQTVKGRQAIRKDISFEIQFTPFGSKPQRT